MSPMLPLIPPKIEFFWIFAIVACFLLDWPVLGLCSVYTQSSLALGGFSVVIPSCFRYSSVFGSVHPVFVVFDCAASRWPSPTAAGGFSSLAATKSGLAVVLPHADILWNMDYLVN